MRQAATLSFSGDIDCQLFTVHLAFLLVHVCVCACVCVCMCLCVCVFSFTFSEPRSTKRLTRVVPLPGNKHVLALSGAGIYDLAQVCSSLGRVGVHLNFQPPPPYAPDPAPSCYCFHLVLLGKTL
jgi:hypothetical protein